MTHASVIRILAAALVALAAVPAAHAADRSQETPKGITVAYGDLDLGTVAGRSELNLRLENAAARLCSPVLARAPDSEPSIREHQTLYRACVGRLSERAIAQVNTGRD